MGFRMGKADTPGLMEASMRGFGRWAISLHIKVRMASAAPKHVCFRVADHEL